MGQQADQQPRRAAPAVSGGERKRQGMGGVSAANCPPSLCCVEPHQNCVVMMAFLPSIMMVSASLTHAYPPQPLPQGVKATLRKLFTSRRSGHQRLPDEDMMDAEDQQHPMASQAQQAQQASFSLGR